jgi:Zn-dependent protease with chaperone function
MDFQALLGLLAIVIIMRLSRRPEYIADAVGASLAGKK